MAKELAVVMNVDATTPMGADVVCGSCSFRNISSLECCDLCDTALLPVRKRSSEPTRRVPALSRRPPLISLTELSRDLSFVSGLLTECKTAIACDAQQHTPASGAAPVRATVTHHKRASEAGASQPQKAHRSAPFESTPKTLPTRGQPPVATQQQQTPLATHRGAAPPSASSSAPVSAPASGSRPIFSEQSAPDGTRVLNMIPPNVACTGWTKLVFSPEHCTIKVHQEAGDGQPAASSIISGLQVAEWEALSSSASRDAFKVRWKELTKRAEEREHWHFCLPRR